MRYRLPLATVTLAVIFAVAPITPVVYAGNQLPLRGTEKTFSRQRPRERGIASWFRTRHRMSVAHRTLPLGTKITVSTKKGRSVVVTVADRGPFIHGRVVDLSSDAFKKLAPLGAGVITVTVDVAL